MKIQNNQQGVITDASQNNQQGVITGQNQINRAFYQSKNQ